MIPGTTKHLQMILNNQKGFDEIENILNLRTLKIIKEADDIL